MDIHTAAKYMAQGYRIRRPDMSGLANDWIDAAGLHGIPFRLEDLMADDWEIITEGIVKDFPLTYSN